jgi:hypothetical protein
MFISSFCRFLNVLCNFCVVFRRILFNSRRFGSLCLFRFHRGVDMKCIRIEICGYGEQVDLLSPSGVGGGGGTFWQVAVTGSRVKMEQCSETSAIKHHALENNPKITHDIFCIVYEVNLEKYTH